MKHLDGKLIKFIEENANRGNYVQKNIQISEETDIKYFAFKPSDDKESSYIIFAAKDIEMPKDIMIPSHNANKPVISIGRNAFCNSYDRVIKNTNIENVTIPENVTNISDEAFSNCIKLRKVTIYGNRVPTIGKKVFMNTSEDLIIYVPRKMVDEYKNNPNWSVYKEKISPTDIPSPEEIPSQDGIVNTVVTVIAESKEVSVAYNFYFLNINDSNVNDSDDIKV
ncbi:MAG: leucine-rich repeat protein [Clostridium sp.]|uniref:leucine-rich repeat protein n=1 Tax=Clostridium sp. TaxID=1506 RepID=UPI003D6D54CC